MDLLLEDRLKEVLRGSVSVVGVGNVMKRDDGLGSILAKRLNGKTGNFRIFDAEDSPENMLGKILKTKADTVLIVDCASFGAAPGSVRLFAYEEIRSSNMFFTHNSSLGLVAKFIKEDAGADVFLLGVQPRLASLGEGLTPELEHILEHLEEIILNLDKNNVLCDPRKGS